MDYSPLSDSHFLHLLFLAHEPEDVAAGDGSLGCGGFDVTVVSFETDDHAAVVLADAALAETQPKEGTLFADDEAAQQQYLTDGSEVGQGVGVEAAGEGFKAAVVADDVQAVAGEDEGVATGNVEAVSTAHDGCHGDAEAGTELETVQTPAAPGACFGNFNAGNVEMASGEASGIERAGGSVRCHVLPRAQVLEESALQTDARPFHKTKGNDDAHDDGGKEGVKPERSGREELQHVAYHSRSQEEAQGESEPESGAVQFAATSQLLPFLRVVLAHDKGAEKGRGSTEGEQTADDVARPVPEEGAAEREQDGEREEDDGDAECEICPNLSAEGEE